MTSRTPNVFIIGGGAVATALAGALRRSGVPVLGLWARRAEASRHAAALSGVAGFTGAVPELVTQADVVIIAVRDEAIREVAATVAESPLLRKNQVFLHCSGALSAAEALAPLRGKVAGIGTLHPLRAFSDARRAAAALPETTFAVEGEGGAPEAARNLIEHIGSRTLALEAGQLPAYHAAAVLAAGGLVALLDAACEVLGQIGLERSAALAALLPLSIGTLDNLGAVGLPEALTGPIGRGDAEVVARNLAAIAKPEAQAAYRVLGRRALALARERGLPEADAERVARVLAEPQSAP